MITLIKNATVYAPELLGKKDILICGGKIENIDDAISLSGIDAEIIDANGKILFPGLIDSHVHVLGGGGEKGFCSRTGEISAETLLSGGITTVVGVIGTDGFTKNMPSLIAKTKELGEKLTAYCLTGSYQVPVKTLTGGISDDIMFVSEIIGVGEIAISDHRGSCPTQDELNKLVASARIGGMLSGKAGVVNFHIGSAENALLPLCNILDNTEIPAANIHPTHINRSEKVFSDGIAYSKKYNATIDFTTSMDNMTAIDDPLNAFNCFIRAIKSGVSAKNITFSSDGQGSLPTFDKNGKIIGFDIGKVSSLWDNVVLAVSSGVDFATALLPVTSNAARVFGLTDCGEIKKGYNANIVICDKNYHITDVFANGKRRVKNGENI